MDLIETRTALRRHLQIRGIVQGVGFRPFVYHLAQTLHLTGYVRNTADAQDMFLTGRTATVEAVVFDAEDRSYLAVTLADDSAAELHQ